MICGGSCFILGLSQAVDTFLLACKDLNITPEPSLMLKQDQPMVDLRHHAIGDQFGLAFARR